jgi:predicted Zn-dependent protease
VEQEIALGLQAAPEMAAQFGGASRDAAATERVQRVGRRLVDALPYQRNPYRFAFHLLEDPKTVNAFALPGGQIFITTGLLTRLRTEGELAGVLAHEIGHVIERHSAERMAQQALTQGITTGVIVAASDPGNPGARSDILVRMVANLVTMKYGRDDERESDVHGVALLPAARYDPRAMLGVMRTLGEASGGSKMPDFASTHPSPDNRRELLEAEIARRFPQGVPAGLDP